MAIENPDSTVAAVDKLFNTEELGHASKVVIEFLSPHIERQLSLLLDRFTTVAPDLASLLDLRSQIAEVWRIRKLLKANQSNGELASKTLEMVVKAQIQASNSNSNNGGGR